MKGPRVLIVEDEAIIALDLKLALEGMDGEVLGIAATAEGAVEKARSGSPDLILMDIMLRGERTGMDAALEIRRFSSVPIVYLTGNSHLRDDPRILATNSQGLFAKPPSASQLREILALAADPASGLS